MKPRFQVFVSSTYLDLQEERQAVIQALLEGDHFPAGMELFPAGNDDQWTRICRVIDDSDYYIVIVGDRYGSIHPTEGLSYTEMEYRYALKAGKPVMAFLVEDPEKLPTERRDLRPEAQGKLNEFRTLLKQRLCKFWRSPDHLTSRVSISLPKLIDDNPARGWVRTDLAGPELPDEVTLALNAGIVPYTKKEFFDQQWRELTAARQAISIIGSPPIEDLRGEIQRLLDDHKSVSLYRSLDSNSKEEILDLLETFGWPPRESFEIFHIDAPFWGSAVIGKGGVDEDPAVLVHYGAARRTFAGLHLHGPPARRLVEAVESRLDTSSSGAILVDWNDKADYVVRKKVVYDRDLRRLVHGVPFMGAKEICTAMTGILRGTKEYLHVTHVAQGETLSMLGDDFSEWLEENFAAVARGVEVVRVFIVPQADRDHPELRRTQELMSSKGIQVRVCPLESLDRQLVRDFSIYDETRLVYIFREEDVGPWTSTSAEARVTVDPKTISEYRVFFDAILGKSEPFEPGADAAVDRASA